MSEYHREEVIREDKQSKLVLLTRDLLICLLDADYTRGTEKDYKIELRKFDVTWRSFEFTCREPEESQAKYYMKVIDAFIKEEEAKVRRYGKSYIIYYDDGTEAEIMMIKDILRYFL